MMKEKNCTKKCSAGPRVLRILLFIIILIQFTSAQATGLMKESGIYKINYITLLVHENGFVDVEEELEVNNTIASIFTPRNILDLLITDSEGNKLQYESVSGNNKQLITFYLLSPDERLIRLRYRTLDLTSKNASTWTLKFSTSSVPRHTIIKIEFPPGSNVISLRPRNILRYPQNLTSPLWLYPQVKDFGFECDYETGPSIPGGDGTHPYAVASIAVMAVVMIFLSIYILRKGKEEKILGEVKEEKGKEEEKVSKIKPSVLNVLEENERKVVEVLQDSDDEITQAYIYKTTGIPKATLSDLMKRLEKRNVIERRRDGRINWIKLKKWVFNK
ncbi:MAG: hypothetical protein DRO89_03795 [Candidatus Altiarchaeales archaeon]|nr:MAG: hypothetical protein DRO89_03795 [Candidatus Altiarchaeales archaeon]